jgi:hypothetical protein
MKTFTILLLSILLFLPSCTVRRIGANGQILSVQHYGPGAPRSAVGYQQQDGQVQTGVKRKLESVDVHKSQTGRCEAWTPTPQAGRRQEIAEYASEYYMKHNKLPSESHLTQKYGFQCKARWIDTPNKGVGKVTVRPDEVPANIRAKFM